jgi:ubiquinone/menaquinone biosynthesis C-methylase UbiE
VIGEPAGWQPFEARAAGYEAWYGTRRGRAADVAEHALLERLLAPFAGARSALEVGCGTGHFTRWLAVRLPRVIGLDRAPAMLTEAQRLRPRLCLIRGDAHRLPIRSRAVDLCVFVIALEFLEHPAAALAEAVRVAQQGVLILALNRWSLGGASRRWGPDARRPLIGRARDFTGLSLRALARAAAGSRLRTLRRAGVLFPGASPEMVARIPGGDVIGLAMELTA